MCSCLKDFVMPKQLTDLTPNTWGPIYWKLLHILSSHVGEAGDMLDGDVANGFFFVINHLHTVLPCADCTTHARKYIAENRFDPRGLAGMPLRTYIEAWLLTFHNAVRIRKEQAIEIETVSAYHVRWRSETFQPCDNESMNLFFDYGKTYHVIDVAQFARWVVQMKRLRLLLGV